MHKWKPVRVKKDPKAPKRYQRSGWIAWNTQDFFAQGAGVWPTREEAQRECDIRNGEGGRWNWTPTEPGAEDCPFWLTFYYQGAAGQDWRMGFLTVADRERWEKTFAGLIVVMERTSREER